jgi:ABC-type multidrug transport system fused ATPase/permease subunit
VSEPKSDRLPFLLVHYFRLFWSYTRGRMVVSVILTLLMTYAEGVGIALFYPLFETDPAARASGFGGTIASFLGWFGLSMTPGSVLPLIVILFTLKGALQYATNRYQFAMFRDVSRQLRRRALTGLAKADYQHVTNTNTGFFTNLIITEIYRSACGFLAYVKSLSPALSAGVLFLMASFFDWRLSLVCVAMGAVMIAVTRFTGFVIRKYSLLATKESSRLTGLVIQLLHAFKYLRATGSYKRFDRRVEDTSNRLLDADYKNSIASSLMGAMSQPIMVLFLCGLLYFRAVVQGAELAAMFVLLVYFFRVMNEVFALQSSWQAFCGYLGSVELVRDAIEKTDAEAERSGSEPFGGLSEAIVFDHVSFSYRTGRQVLDDISLRIPAKTTVAFVGGSGAGKSTLVDLMTGTLRATGGTITMDGHSLATMDLGTLRQHIGYVPQDAVLFDDTVAANIALWSENYTLEQIRDAAERARCLEFIERMPQQFDTPIGDRGVKLSGGQRQRLAIARELVRSPDLLVLDEATSALDSESEAAIQQSIDQLQGKVTIVLIAHRLSTIRGADRVYVLSEGKIVEEGRFDELASRPGGKFRRMCELQELAP